MIDLRLDVRDYIRGTDRVILSSRLLGPSMLVFVGYQACILRS